MADEKLPPSSPKPVAKDQSATAIEKTTDTARESTPAPPADAPTPVPVTVVNTDAQRERIFPGGGNVIVESHVVIEPHLDNEIETDNDSAIDSDSLRSTDSLTPSILEYREYQGRTFANATTGELWSPNDERANEGLDLIHNALTMLLQDKLFVAPIDEENPGRILDIGTGTGIWAMDFADEYPSAEVIGTDLSPIQPTWVPPNLKFEIDDCLLDWTWPQNHFDFVHVRCLNGSVPSWIDLYRKILDHLKPGGWYQQVEISCRLRSDHVDFAEDHPFEVWCNKFHEAGEKMGRPFDICENGKLKQDMIEAGFVDVTEVKVKQPIGSWPKDSRLKQAGTFFYYALERDLEGFAMFVLQQVLGWSLEKTLMLVAEVRAEAKKRSNCTYGLVTVVYGRKPE